MTPTKWVVLAEVGVAVLLIGASGILGVTLGVGLLAALGLFGLVLFLPIGAGRKTTACMCIASFFAATMLKPGGTLQLTDLFIFLAAAPLVLGLDGPRRPPELTTASRFMLLGMALISLGGLIGGLFQPHSNPFVYTAGYQGSKLGPISIRFADDVRFTIFTSGLILLVRIWRPSRRAGRAVLISYGVGVVASLLFGLAANGFSQPGRVHGLTSHPVFFGLISAFGVMIGLGLMSSPTTRGRLFAIAVIIAGAVGILTSGTRSALTVAVAAIVIMQFGQRSIRSTIALVTTVAVGLLIFLTGPQFFGSLPLIDRLTGGGYANASAQARVRFRDETLALIKAHGITGAGFRYIVPPHNLILGVLGATGAIGLIGLIVVIGVLIVHFLHTPAEDIQVLAVLSAGLGLFANSWVVNAAWDRWLWLPIIVVIALPQGDKEPPEEVVMATGHTRGRDPLGPPIRPE